jgi:threonine 3-dehydrogenase
MTMAVETILITGGSGFIGLELSKVLMAEGHRIAVFDMKSPEPLLCGEGSVDFVCRDITNFSQVLNGVRDFRPDTIVHLAALLSEPSERNPWASISVNALGTYHVLEAARLFGVKKVIFSSSMAVYVNERTRVEVVSEETVQRPPLIYGVTKVFSELLALYYHSKFGMDTRGVRLPALIGPYVKSPGFGQFNSRMIEAAIRGESFEVNVPEDTVIPLLYIKDAIRSLAMLYHAPEQRLLTRIYNVGQMMPPPRTIDLVNVVRRYYPDTRITFNPELRASEVARNTPREILCHEARDEWGWHTAYSPEETVKDFIATVTHDQGRR